MKRLLVILLGSVLLLSCSDEPLVHPTEDLLCGDSLYHCGSIFGFTYSWNNIVPSYYSPVFNPNDPHEIMYLKRAFDGSTWNISLERYNYVSQSHQIVISSNDMTANNLNFWKYQWGANDWIVFENDYNSQIYKIKSDGTQLSQFTFSGNSFFPFLSITGDTVFFSNVYGSSLIEGGIIANIETNTFLDTISGSFGMGAFLGNGRIVCNLFDQDTIRILDAGTLTLLDKFYPNNGDPNFASYNFFGRVSGDTNSIIVFEPMKAIYQLNLINHTAQSLRTACGSDQINFQSVAPDASKIAFTVVRNSNTISDPCMLIQRAEIHLMNIDGSDEQLIQLLE